MIRWILTFLVLAIVCAVLGFGGLAASFSWVAQVLAIVFAVMVVASILARGIEKPSTSGL